MKRAKLETLVSPSRLRLLQLLMGIVFLCILVMTIEIPLVFRTESDSHDGAFGFLLPGDELDGSYLYRKPKRQMQESKRISGLVFNESLFDAKKDEFSELYKSAKQAWVIGKKFWDEMESKKTEFSPKNGPENRSETCPNSITLSAGEFRNRVLELPCGLTLWSHITVVGTPRWGHPENDPKISVLNEGDESVMVSQFMMELQGLKIVDGEDPPRILHFNPRLKGDWSKRPVIEQNTCYRMQWGTALRCEGWKSRADEETGR